MPVQGIRDEKESQAYRLADQPITMIDPGNVYIQTSTAKCMLGGGCQQFTRGDVWKGGLVVGGGGEGGGGVDVLPEFRHFVPTTGELLHACSGLVGVPLSYGGARVICCRS